MSWLKTFHAFFDRPRRLSVTLMVPSSALKKKVAKDILNLLSADFRVKMIHLDAAPAGLQTASDTVCTLSNATEATVALRARPGMGLVRDLVSAKPAFLEDSKSANVEALDADQIFGVEVRASVLRQNTQEIAQTISRICCEVVFRVRGPWLRNDDVSGDTDYESFAAFCALFTAKGWRQLHGITLFGRTNSYEIHEGECVEYRGAQSLSVLSNEEIRELSRAVRFDERLDLIDFLTKSHDDIALHGLFHTDYSIMPEAEQFQDMQEGLRLLRSLFPSKEILYFIAPFNRTNAGTFKAADALGLRVLADDGVHLEEMLQTMLFTPRTWHRYHHHRFYPESTFPHWDLNMVSLAAALNRNQAYSLPVSLPGALNHFS